MPEPMSDEQRARQCARSVRGCTTDEQYIGLQDAIAEALATARAETWAEAIKVSKYATETMRRFAAKEGE